MGLRIIVFASVTDAECKGGSVCLYLEGSCEVLFRVRQPVLLLPECSPHFIDRHTSKLIWPVCVCCSTNEQAAEWLCGDGTDTWTRAPMQHTTKHRQTGTHGHTSCVRMNKYFKSEEKQTHTLHHIQMPSSVLHGTLGIVLFYDLQYKQYHVFLIMQWWK